MRKYIYIGCGGFIGAVARYLIKGIRIPGYTENIPLNTLVINVAGAFLLALILTVALEVRPIHTGVRLGLTVGFLGALTTFSTFCKETVTLIANGDYFSAIVYVTVSIALGLAAAYFGVVLARELGKALERKKESRESGPDSESDVG